MLRTFDSGYNSDCLEQYKTKISPVESYNNETYVPTFSFVLTGLYNTILLVLFSGMMKKQRRTTKFKEVPCCI